MLKEENYDERADLIVKAFQYWQKCWADELNARPTEEKSTIKGFLSTSQIKLYPSALINDLWFLNNLIFRKVNRCRLEANG